MINLIRNTAGEPSTFLLQILASRFFVLLEAIERQTSGNNALNCMYVYIMLIFTYSTFVQENLHFEIIFLLYIFHI